MNVKIIGLLLALGGLVALPAGQTPSTGPVPFQPAPVEPAIEETNLHSDFAGTPGAVGESPYTDAGNVTWAYGTACPKTISRTAACVAGGKLHVVTGEVSPAPNRVPDQIFDFATNTWSEGLSHPGGGISNGDAIAVSDTLICVGGGYTSTGGNYNNITLLNLSANTWTAGATMPIASLMYYAMAASGGNAYVFGGAYGTSVSNQAHRYDPATNSFTALANMPLALRSQVAVTAGDTIYLIGGHPVSGTPYNGTTHFLKYSISGDNWTTGPAMPYGTTWGRGAAYHDPAHGWVIYTFGGYNASGAYTNQVWAYTVSTGTWEACNNLLAARRSHAGAIWGDTLLAVCGYSGSGFLGSVERGAIDYTPPTGFEALWLYADYTDPDTTLGYRLRALGDTLTYMNVQSYTPTLAELLPYDAVGAHSNYGYADPTALGNVLASYVDSGGGVVLANFCFTNDGHGMGGAIMTGNYATMTQGNNTFQNASLGWNNGAHPIMDGVTSVGDYYRTVPTFLAESVAKWDDGRPYVAVSANQKVAGLNQYPGCHVPPGRTGDWALVIHNALRFVTGMTGTKEFDPFR
ncbi:hypothetical protein JXB37_02805, partial [candidate division WOR-3 bacterium]|nr:hypothetical protein [candidate division WOR-3 bacterium]